MQMLQDKYSKEADIVKKETAAVSHVALTSDLWTSRATESYMTITCHFLTEMWELRSLVLETFHLELSHTAENIANSVRKAAEKWKISEKIVAIVTDNVSNIVAAVKIVGWNHVPCFSTH